MDKLEDTEDLDETLLRELNNEIQVKVSAACREAAEKHTSRLLRHQEAILQAQRRSFEGFKARLYDRWADALDLYQLALYCATNCGNDFLRSFANPAARQNDFTFEAITRLYGSAVLVATEVFNLLLGGFASGAHARWRTLHEIAVVMMFIESRPKDVAERFLQHRAVKKYQDAFQYRKYQDDLGVQEVTDSDLVVLKQAADELINRYGREYMTDKGWAAAAIKAEYPEHQGDITIKDLERAVGTEHWIPYYRMASHAVHPSSTSIYFNIGTLEDVPYTLSGPSNAGLADPGHGSLVSLAHAASTFMTAAMRLSPQDPFDVDDILKNYQPALNVMVKCLTLDKLVEMAGDAFLAAHEQQVKEEQSLGSESEVHD